MQIAYYHYLTHNAAWYISTRSRFHVLTRSYVSLTLYLQSLTFVSQPHWSVQTPRLGTTDLDNYCKL